MRPTRALALLVLVAGCATTIAEPTSPSSVLPTVAPAELPDNFDAVLRALVDRAELVAAAMNDGDRERAAEELTGLDRVWRRLEPLAAERGRRTRDDTARLVALAVTAVERNRPADADKAVRFLSLLLDGAD